MIEAAKMQVRSAIRDRFAGWQHDKQVRSPHRRFRLCLEGCTEEDEKSEAGWFKGLIVVEAVAMVVVEGRRWGE